MILHLKKGDEMEHFNFMKKLFDANQEEFTLEEIQNLSKLSRNEVEEKLKVLCEEKLLINDSDHYSITPDGRVDFANTYSKRVMIRILLFSIFTTLVLYVLARLLT